MPASRYRALLLCCLLAAPATALAQEDSPKQDLTVGGTKRTQNTVGDWSVDCTEKAGEQRRCKMKQQAVSAKTGKTVISWLIGRDGKGEEAMSFQTPTGLLLPAGLRLAIDGNSPVVVPFRTCVTQVCEAVLPLTGELVGAMQAGSKATVTLTGLDEKTATFNMSLKGFTGAYRIYQGKS